MAGTDVAQRYAEALADVVAASSTEERTRVRSELRAFEAALGESFDLSNLLHNPSVASGDRRRGLESVLQMMGVSDPTSRFVRLLAERGRVDRLGEIIEAFERIDDARSGVIRAHVTSAAPLETDAVDRLRAALEARTGRKLDIVTEVDPSLIAGIRAQVGSMVFDASIKNELERLREQLQS